MGLEQRNGKFGSYWGNTYDSSKSLNQSQMEENAKYIYSYLSSEGWTINAVAGILGNMQSESSINPGRWESDRVAGNPDAHGYGLVQWTPYTKYTDWIVNQGFNDPSEMDANIYRILYEVENNIQWIATSTYNYSFKEFIQSTDTPYNLALAFLSNYERPADPNQPARGTQAEKWYEFLTGIVPPEPKPNKKANKFKWVLYANKLRNNRLRK